MVVGDKIVMRNTMLISQTVHGTVTEIDGSMAKVVPDNDPNYFVMFDNNSYRGIGRFGKWIIEGVIKQK